MRLARALLATVLAALCMVPSVARADGDPASDVLLGENVFYPYSPPVSQPIQNALDTETAAAVRAHFPVKVALIGSPVDLGVIPGMFGKPQEYADFLDQEISFQTKQPLLVVMADGYGVQGLPPAATAALPSLRKPAGTQPEQLAQAAITAVGKLAAAAGHPIAAAVPGPAKARSSAAGSGSSSRALILILVAVAAVATVVTLVVVRLRQAATR